MNATVKDEIVKLWNRRKVGSTSLLQEFESELAVLAAEFPVALTLTASLARLREWLSILREEGIRARSPVALGLGLHPATG
jgi:hypothetical protein